MRFSAVLFDLDGTLLDTLQDIAESANRVLHERGLPTYNQEAYKHFVGDGVEMLIIRALPDEKRDPEMIRSLKESFREDYASNWKNSTAPYPGVLRMLEELRARGMKLAVLSNKPESFTQQCVEEFFPRDTFQAVHGQREDGPLKPDPATALEIADTLGLRPERILYVGDTGVDMETAVNAGMYPAGALWGFRPWYQLQRCGARSLLNRPEEVLELVPEADSSS
jgi:phosphoglycolate phosphatase